MYKYEVYVGEGTDAPVYTTDDAVDAFWAMVRQLGASGLAGPATMESIRACWLAGEDSTWCNGVRIQRVQLINTGLLDDLHMLTNDDERYAAVARVIGALLSDDRQDVIEATLQAAGFSIS